MLSGGLGVDTMSGGAGNDIYVTDGTDMIIESRTGGTDEVRSTASATLSANVEILTLIGNTAINGTGNATANLIMGNAKANTLDGGAKVFGINYEYAFSKRTAGLIGWNQMDNDPGSAFSQGKSAATRGGKQQSMGIAIKHRF